MSDDWQKIDADRAARILDEVNPHLDPVPFSVQHTSIRGQKLSFYRGHEILELTDLSVVPAARKYAIYKQGDVNVVNWTNQPIYETNEKAPITLDDRTIVDYTKFFFSYVRGRTGRFNVIEKIDDIRWQNEPAAQDRKTIQDLLRPVTVLGKDADGTFNLEAYMLFKDALLKTKIHVKPDGLMAMSDESLIVGGMRVLQDAA